MKLGFDENLVTPFESNLNTQHPFNEYPRPTMVRDSYMNLNGYYDYKIRLPSGNISDFSSP